MSTESIIIELPKPFGILLEEVSGGGVRVEGLIDGGNAKKSGKITPGMRLLTIAGRDYSTSTFDEVMATLVKEEAPVSLTFTASAKPLARALEEEARREPPVAGRTTAVLTVIAPGGGSPKDIKAVVGANLRRVLLDNKVQLYDFVGTVSNCNGAGQCGSC
ncbi:unnamed protein product, partial [Phaeothamnion confervicola]